MGLFARSIAPLPAKITEHFGVIILLLPFNTRISPGGSLQPSTGCRHGNNPSRGGEVGESKFHSRFLGLREEQLVRGGGCQSGAAVLHRPPQPSCPRAAACANAAAACTPLQQLGASPTRVPHARDGHVVTALKQLRTGQ